MQTPASTIVNTGDLGGHKITMTIDQTAMAHIMSILTDLYSDPLGAVIREYSTNARDAHIEAGNPDPIEIVLPNAYSPFFKIIDHGVGLSVDDIERIYSQYGASTKRGTNEQTGMLGLGAKSALTLVPQFNLTSIKNGVRIAVSVSRSGDGGGQMEVIDTRATDEPNGVEIQIPISNSYDLREKVANFFRFWPEGSVLVDGKEPTRITGEKVGDKFILSNDFSLAGRDYVVMGGVAYPVKEGLYGNSQSGYQMGIVAFVEIGEVNFTPSREELQYTPTTNATIAALKDEFTAEIDKKITADIAGSADWYDAWKAQNKWREKFPAARAQFRGEELPGKTIGINKSRSWRIEAGRYSSNGTVASVGPDSQGKYLFVTGFANPDLKASPTMRKKAEIWLKGKGLSVDRWSGGVEYMIVTQSDKIAEDPAREKYLKGFLTVTWAELNKIRVPRTTPSGTIRTEPYDIIRIDGAREQVSTFDTTKSILYYTPAQIKRPTWVMKIIPDAQLVELPVNRWAKFQRDWPSAQRYETAIQNEVKKLSDKLTLEDRIYHFYSGMSWTFPALDEKRVDDPEIKEFYRIINGKASPELTAWQSLPSSVYKAGLEKPANPLTRYPFHGNLRGVETKHIYWYLNTYYNTELKGN